MSISSSKSMSYMNSPKTKSKKDGDDSVENPKARGKPLVDDDFEPLLGKPCCHIILTKSNIKPIYHMVFPSKLYKDLPGETVPAAIVCSGKTWDAVLCVDKKFKRIDGRWKHFVDANELHVGDAVFWEVLESNNEKVKFKVQIIRGDLPSEEVLEPKVISGTTEDTAILIVDD